MTTTVGSFGATDCPICYDSFDKGQATTVTSCGHASCTLCLDRWFSTYTTCPVCNRTLKDTPTSGFSTATYILVALLLIFIWGGRFVLLCYSAPQVHLEDLVALYTDFPDEPDWPNAFDVPCMFGGPEHKFAFQLMRHSSRSIASTVLHRSMDTDISRYAFPPHFPHATEISSKNTPPEWWSTINQHADHLLEAVDARCCMEVTLEGTSPVRMDTFNCIPWFGRIDAPSLTCPSRGLDLRCIM